MAISYNAPRSPELGPLLFSIYVYDLTGYLQRSAKYVMYADDCAIVVSAYSKEEVCSNLERVILTLHWWFRVNNLLMSHKKTHFLQIRNFFLCRQLWNVLYI